MLRNIVVPFFLNSLFRHSFPGFAEVLINLQNRLPQESTGACGRVQHLNSRNRFCIFYLCIKASLVFPFALAFDFYLLSFCRCQTIGNTKFRFQNIIHSPDDKIDHRLGRIVDASLHFLGLVILRQEFFVEVDHWVFTAASGLTVKVSNNGVCLCILQKRYNISDFQFIKGQFRAGTV